MRDFDKVLEKLRDTTSVQEINELKEYFVNEYPEIFRVEYNFKEINIEKHNKKIKEAIDDMKRRHIYFAANQGNYWKDVLSREET